MRFAGPIFALLNKLISGLIFIFIFSCLPPYVAAPEQVSIVVSIVLVANNIDLVKKYTRVLVKNGGSEFR